MSALPRVEYLAHTRIGEKGQLTIPKAYRDELGLDTGAPVAVLRIGEGLILIPEPVSGPLRLYCLSIRGAACLFGRLGEVSARSPPARLFSPLQRVCKNGIRDKSAGPATLTQERRVRLFLDSNVLTGGIVSPWGLDRAVLALCAARIPSGAGRNGARRG
jgi:AbrB family looped-hinge helix DNA binding protein